jgi:hypothetical protein
VIVIQQEQGDNLLFWRVLLKSEKKNEAKEPEQQNNFF